MKESWFPILLSIKDNYFQWETIKMNLKTFGIILEKVMANQIATACLHATCGTLMRSHFDAIHIRKLLS